MKFEKDGKVVIIPNHNSKGVETGTYYSILRQAKVAPLFSQFIVTRIRAEFFRHK